MKLQENVRRYDGALNRRALRVMYPVQIALSLIVGINGAIDGMIIGRFYGHDALSALGLSTPVTVVVWMFVNLIMAGAKVLTGNALGRGENAQADGLFTYAMILCLIVPGLLVPGVIYGASDSIAVLLGARGTVAELTARYLRGFAFAVPGLVMMNFMGGFLVYDYVPKLNLAASLLMMAANCTMNFLFAVRQADIFWIAIATAISYYLPSLLYLAFFLTGRSRFRFARVDVGCTRQMLSLGSGQAMTDLCMTLRPLLINLLLMRFVGQTAVAALAVEGSIAGMFGPFQAGFGAALLPLTCIYVGEKDEAALEDLFRSGFRVCFPIMAGFFALIFVFAAPVTAFFTHDAEIQHLAAGAVRALMVQLTGNALSVPVFSCLQAMGQSRKVLVLNMVDSLLLPALICGIGVPLLGIWGVYLYFLTAPFLVMAVIVLWFRHETGNRKPGWIELLLWNQKLDVPESDRLAVTVESIEETGTASEYVQNFALTHGMSSRNSSVASLMVEELCTNIFLHGKRKNLRADVRVIYDNGTIKIQIRDNGRPFDPVSRFHNSDEKDKTRNIGIRMAAKLPTAIRYQALFGMNLVTIDIS